MKSANRSNALLVELLIVILFFMLSSTVLMQVFSTAHRLTERAGVRSAALNDAQNVADRLILADSLEEAVSSLREQGFEETAAAYTLERAGYALRVTLESQPRTTGILLAGAVEALQGDEPLFTLPTARYLEVQP